MKSKSLINTIQTQIVSITTLQWVVVVLIATFTVGTIKFFGRTSTTVVKYITLQISTTDWRYTNVNPSKLTAPLWIISALKQKNVINTSLGNTKAEIIQKEAYQIDTEETLAYVQLKLTGYVNKRTQMFIYDNQTIFTGAHITVNTNKVTLIGNVIDLSDSISSPVTKTVTYRAIIPALQPWRQDVVKNTKINELFSGKSILLIDSVSFQPPASTVFISDWSSTRTNQFLTQNPQVKDVVITGKIDVIERDGQYYFMRVQPIQIGEIIYFNDPHTGTYTAEIQAITE